MDYFEYNDVVEETKQPTLMPSFPFSVVRVGYMMFSYANNGRPESKSKEKKERKTKDWSKNKKFPKLLGPR